MSICPDFEELADTYKKLGGAHGAILNGDIAVLIPHGWSSDEADLYWREHIGILPADQRNDFLIALAKQDSW